MLDSLRIKNFRCLEDFRVERLGRLNLIVGGNNSGKSTVLEALRIYAGNANRLLLVDLARSHDETSRPSPAPIDAADAEADAPLQDFFTGRRFPTAPGVAIEIGTLAEQDQPLRLQLQFQQIEDVVVEEEQPDGSVRRRVLRRRILSDRAAASSEQIPALVVSQAERTLDEIALDDSLPQRSLTSLRRLEANRAMNCQVVSTQLARHSELKADWDKVVFQPAETYVHAALRIIEPRFRNLTFLQSEETSNAFSAHRPVVLLEGDQRPLPLGSLGEGMRRVLQIILKMVNARNGLLLIDEFENGLHYSVQPKVWAMLFELAERLNVQVFATTHSWDCIKAFAEVAKANEHVDGVLFHMGRSVRRSNKGQVIATVYDEQALYDMTQADLEVR
jgi:predicted ATP-dependent endonuclease of OLD family